jgi:hypothetical protein
MGASMPMARLFVMIGVTQLLSPLALLQLMPVSAETDSPMMKYPVAMPSSLGLRTMETSFMAQTIVFMTLEVSWKDDACVKCELIGMKGQNIGGQCCVVGNGKRVRNPFNVFYG